MRLNETIAGLNDVVADMGISAGGYVITGYSAVTVENVGVISDVKVVFPVGRNYTASAQTHLAGNFNIYVFLDYNERYSSILPVALTGLEFHFTWTDSIGGN